MGGWAFYEDGWRPAMKCERVQENMVLYLYDELDENQCAELQRHLEQCEKCANEMQQARGFHNQLNAVPLREPSPNQLAFSRVTLGEALEEGRLSGIQRLLLAPVVWFREVGLAPALAGAIFLAGFGGGIATTYKMLAGGQR